MREDSVPWLMNGNILKGIIDPNFDDLSIFLLKLINEIECKSERDIERKFMKKFDHPFQSLFN